MYTLFFSQNHDLFFNTLLLNKVKLIDVSKIKIYQQYPIALYLDVSTLNIFTSIFFVIYLFSISLSLSLSFSLSLPPSLCSTFTEMTLGGTFFSFSSWIYGDFQKRQKIGIFSQHHCQCKRFPLYQTVKL